MNFGFCGKIPTRGDFVSRNLPPDFVEAWVAWLSDCFTNLRKELPAVWLTLYANMPIWRFAIKAGGFRTEILLRYHHAECGRGGSTVSADHCLFA